MLFSAILLAASAVVAKPTLQTRQATAKAYASNQDLSLKLSEVDAPVKDASNPGDGATWDLTVDDSDAGHKQTIKGFGGTVTDATVIVINALPSDQRSKLLKELLTDEGVNFSFLRHTIGASDLSPPPASTYDDNNNEADPNLDNFGLGDSGVAMAKMLAEMKGINPDATILGSSWSPPGWMKVSRVSPHHPSSYATDLLLCLCYILADEVVWVEIDWCD